MKQKLTAFLLCFVMVLSLCAVLPFGSLAEESSADIWDGSVAASFAGGDGSAENPYQIANGAQLALMAQQVNAGINADKSFVLVADIALNDVTNYENFSATVAPANKWTSIGKLIDGTTIYPFKGSFDGQGHSISGLYFYFRNIADYYHGLFGYAQDATIKNVILEKGYVSSAFYLGALVGYAKNCEISGVTNESVKVYGYKNKFNHAYHVVAGGLIGKADNGTVIFDCHNKASVTARNDGDSRDACGNAMNAYGGGIVGIMSASTIIGCSNVGPVKSQFAHNYQNGFVGGIVALASSASTVRGCYSSSEITYSFPGTGHAGGVVGKAEGGTLVAYNVSDATITCIVHAKNREGANEGNGGIVGVTSGSKVEYNVFYGVQKPNTKIAAYVQRTGAIVGETDKQSEIRNNKYYIAEGTVATSHRGPAVTPKGESDNVVLTAIELASADVIAFLNNHVLAGNTVGGLFVQGTSGPVFAAAYAESYTIDFTVGNGGTASVVTPALQIPESFGLPTLYKAGETIAVFVEAQEGYFPNMLELVCNGETELLSRGEDGMFRFVMPSAPVSLNASFFEASTTTQLTVIFLAKDGSVLSEQTVAYGAAAIPPEAPALEGCQFIGWDTDYTVVKDNLVITAVYDVNTYTVTFLGKDGVVLATQIVEHGAAATAPLNTDLFGHSFLYWDTTFDCIKEDLTVNAVYEFVGNFFSGGKGTANDPWQIGTAKDLYDLNNYITNPDTMDIFVSACYELIADIDLTNVADLWDDPAYSNFFVKDKKGALAQNWLPIPTFSGSIDGNGYTISNLIIKNALQDQAMFSYFGGSLKNLTMKDCHVSTGSNYGYRAIIAAYTQGTLVVENCHVIDAKIGSGNNASLMFGTATGTSVTIKGCTVSGSVVESGLNLNVGGFFAICKATTFIDCTSSLVVDNRNIKQAGGFVGGCNDGVTFENCISLAKISIDSARTRGSNIGGFAGWINNNSTVSANNCTFSGILENNDSGSSAAAGFSCSVPANRTTVLTNIAIYGSVYGRLTSGGIFASVGNNQTIDLKNILVLAELSTSDVGLKGAVAASLNPKAGTKFENIYIASEDVMVDSANASVSITYNVLTSLTTLPEGLSSDVWAIDAMPVLSGVSVSLGNNMSINVFAKVGIVLKAHVGKLYVDGQYITAGEKVMLGATEYVKFIYDGFKVADMDKALKLSLVGYNAVQKEYAITTYITNVYGAEDGKYQPLLDAILYYGDAAQKAKYGTSTVLATAASKLEKEFSADYVATNFTKANLKTHAGLSAAGIALNLYGNITPILMVDASVEEVTVTYNGKTATMATQLAVDEDGNEYAYVIYTELLATSLNNLMTVSYTLDGEEVSFDTNIAMYIETALNTQDFLTENEANLARALAVYMRAARTYHEVLYPEVSE